MKKKNEMIRRAGETIPVTVKKGSEDVLKRLAVLNKQQPHAVLATVSDNMPYTSLIAYAITPDLKGLIFATPRKTRKYRNIIRNRNVCLLLDSRANTANDYIKAESISVLGSANLIKKGTKREDLIKIFIEKHPGLKDFVHTDSTALILVKITKYIHVNSFQVVSEMSMGPL